MGEMFDYLKKGDQVALVSPRGTFKVTVTHLTKRYATVAGLRYRRSDGYPVGEPYPRQSIHPWNDAKHAHAMAKTNAFHLAQSVSAQLEHITPDVAMMVEAQLKELRRMIKEVTGS